MFWGAFLGKGNGLLQASGLAGSQLPARWKGVPRAMVVRLNYRPGQRPESLPRGGCSSPVHTQGGELLLILATLHFLLPGLLTC